LESFLDMSRSRGYNTPTSCCRRLLGSLDSQYPKISLYQ